MKTIPTLIKGETAKQYNLRRQKEVFGINDEELKRFQEFRWSLRGKLLFAWCKLTGENFYQKYDHKHH